MINREQDPSIGVRSCNIHCNYLLNHLTSIIGWWVGLASLLEQVVILHFHWCHAYLKACQQANVVCILARLPRLGNELEALNGRFRG